MIPIQAKHAYPFPVEKVFSAFLTSPSVGNFMFRTDGGQLIQADWVPEAGGTFILREKRGDHVQGHFGTFLEFESNEKISFVFTANEGEDQSDYVELFFNPTANGCEIKLQTEVKPEYASQKDQFAQSWKKILDRLERELMLKNQGPSALVTKDSLGQPLSEGDTVKTIKDLKVRGSSMVVKRGTVVKKIHLIAGNDEEVDCKVDGVALSLETQWLAKM